MHLIKQLWSLSNIFDSEKSIDYRIVGYVDTKEEADKIIEDGGTFVNTEGKQVFKFVSEEIFPYNAHYINDTKEDDRAVMKTTIVNTVKSFLEEINELTPDMLVSMKIENIDCNYLAIVTTKYKSFTVEVKLI